MIVREQATDENSAGVGIVVRVNGLFVDDISFDSPAQ
jgi:hypothetical protein